MVVTVSSCFRVTIPRDVRARMNLRPGTTLEVFLHDDRIEMIPVRDPQETRGFLVGIDTTIENDPERV